MADSTFNSGGLNSNCFANHKASGFVTGISILVYVIILREELKIRIVSKKGDKIIRIPGLRGKGFKWLSALHLSPGILSYQLDWRLSERKAPTCYFQKRMSKRLLKPEYPQVCMKKNVL